MKIVSICTESKIPDIPDGHCVKGCVALSIDSYLKVSTQWLVSQDLDLFLISPVAGGFL